MIDSDHQTYVVENFLATNQVPRETMNKFQRYFSLLEQWNPRINLVSQTSLHAFWNRHILDSLQLLPHIPKGSNIVDIGSGAGFPGMVLALCDVFKVHLIEADSRKCVFLQEVASQTQTDISIINQRVEKVVPFSCHTIMARAFASLSRFITLARHLIAHSHQCLLLKGATWRSEIAEAQKNWQFYYHSQPSITHHDAALISLSHLKIQESLCR